MSEKIGRFEIISQLAQSPLATVHKALDTESQQTVALKVVRLDQVKDRATLLKQIFEEADQAKRPSMARAMKAICCSLPLNTFKAIRLRLLWRAKTDFPSGTCKTSLVRFARRLTMPMATT